MVKCRINGTAGKWGMAVSNVESMQVAREAADLEMVKIISPAVDVLSTMQNSNTVDLSQYSVA